MSPRPSSFHTECIQSAKINGAGVEQLWVDAPESFKNEGRGRLLEKGEINGL